MKVLHNTLLTLYFVAIYPHLVIHMETTVTRTFRMPEALVLQLQEKARALGYINPSEYLRHLVRKQVEQEEVR